MVRLIDQGDGAMRIGAKPGLVAAIAGLLIVSAAACSSSDDEGSNSSTSTPTNSTLSAGAACATGGDVTLTEIEVIVDGTTRTAVVHVPSEATGTEPLPVVLSFHGGGELAENRPEVDRFMTLGYQNGFVSVYPQGLVGDAGPVSGVTGWDIEATAVDEPAFVAALLDELGTQVCIDESRVYAAGNSNGGAMALLLACELSDRIAAVASVEGAVLEPGCTGDPSPVPTIAFHGLDDTIVPYAGSTSSGGGFPPVLDVMAARAAINGCTGDPTVETVSPTVERRTWNGCTAPVVLYTLNNHGHAWPGHPLPVSQEDLASFIPPSMSGAMTADEFAANMLLTNNDIDASELIWEFFDTTAR
jgi:polyhydroxybutyrate depolymerase